MHIRTHVTAHAAAADVVAAVVAVQQRRRQESVFLSDVLVYHFERNVLPVYHFLTGMHGTKQTLTPALT